MKNYTVQCVTRDLNGLATVEVDGVKEEVRVQQYTTEVGKTSWGKIDYLVRLGFVLLRVWEVRSRRNSA
jgi:hydrogenase maturation factor